MEHWVEFDGNVVRMSTLVVLALLAIHAAVGGVAAALWCRDVLAKARARLQLEREAPWRPGGEKLQAALADLEMLARARCARKPWQTGQYPHTGTFDTCESALCGRVRALLAELRS